MEMDFGILDLGAWPRDYTFNGAIQDTLEIVRFSEALGCSRYWVAEHHQHNSLFSAPEIFVGWLAASTAQIRIGTAGILLRYRNPYILAQAFGLLASLFPNRIDLGIARGAIAGPITKLFPGEDVSQHGIEQKCDLLVSLLRQAPDRSIVHPPGQVPELWALGGRGAAITGGRNTMNYCLDSLFCIPTDRDITDTVEAYNLESSRHPHNPGLTNKAMAIAGICSETTHLADTQLKDAVLAGFPVHTLAATVIGSQDTWRSHLTHLLTTCRFDTFIFLITSFDPAVRKNSIRLIAEVLRSIHVDSTSAAS
jgi:alkanesulfonate monooxygenase SsuD/methylene tetrahydromethanopterin reductase-like flavin-dependent oxidoreductase (luciferase family)